MSIAAIDNLKTRSVRIGLNASNDYQMQQPYGLAHGNTSAYLAGEEKMRLEKAVQCRSTSR
jgi:hypothetical protein